MSLGELKARGVKLCDGLASVDTAKFVRQQFDLRAELVERL